MVGAHNRCAVACHIALFSPVLLPLPVTIATLPVKARKLGRVNAGEVVPSVEKSDPSSDVDDLAI